MCNPSVYYSTQISDPEANNGRIDELEAKDVWNNQEFLDDSRYLVYLFPVVKTIPKSSETGTYLGAILNVTAQNLWEHGLPYVRNVFLSTSSLYLLASFLLGGNEHLVSLSL